MKICVLGLWHLGSVTAACLASAGHDVIGLDFDDELIAKLQQGISPIYEPGLEDLVKAGLASGKLRFTTSPEDAGASAEILWCAYDTPVDDDDVADVGWVVERLVRVLPNFPEGALVLISSQLPVGTTRRVEANFQTKYPDRQLSFGYSPENLRLGSAINVFTKPDRIVVGLRHPADQERVKVMLAPFSDRIEWMSVESAEMTKHAINAFLATSVTFANDIAVLCEQVGADAKEVERGLKSESRIGPKAYLAPGGAFAGGTLARDIHFLNSLGDQLHQETPLLAGVEASNDHHKSWVQRKLIEIFGTLNGRHLAVWGLTYKPGTDTLRRSSSVELCQWAAQQGAIVQAYDPAVKSVPPNLPIQLADSALDALVGAQALILATGWPEFRQISADEVCEAAPDLVVVDVNRFLEKTLGSDSRLFYSTVGKPIHI